MKRVVCLNVAIALGGIALAQQAPPITQPAGITPSGGAAKLQPRAAVPNGTPFEAEVIEVGQLMAIPNRIQRHPGKFVLVVKNENRADWNAAFLIDPSSVGNGVVGSNPLIVFGGKGLSDVKNRSAAVVVLPAGEWDLKSATTGRIVCQIEAQ